MQKITYNKIYLSMWQNHNPLFHSSLYKCSTTEPWPPYLTWSISTTTLNYDLFTHLDPQIVGLELCVHLFCDLVLGFLVGLEQQGARQLHIFGEQAQPFVHDHLPGVRDLPHELPIICRIGVSSSLRRINS